MAEMTLCEQCGKEPATVFVLAKQGDSERRQALCLRCAEKRKIPSVKEYIRQNKTAGFQMCEKCGELPALVTVSAAKDGAEPEKQSLCGFCARAQGIPQVEEMLAQMQMSDDELRKLHEDCMQQTQEPVGFLQRLIRIFKG